MSNQTTAYLGIKSVADEIKNRGGSDIKVCKEGNRQFIEFLSPNGRAYRITTRAKRSGTWQTMTTYGAPKQENTLEDHYWVFVDLASSPPKYFPIPFWWISNDIYEAHERVLARHGGHRARNDSSVHHAVQLKRIKRWENQWQNLGL